MRQRNKKLDNATIIDVAQEAGVSYSTVSRVVNNNSHVKPDTRERVLSAMTRLGYTVNQQARSLAGGSSQVIGLLCPALNTAYIGEIIRGIDEELVNAQYDLMLYTVHRRKTKESVYVSTLTRGLAEGLLLVLPENPGAYLDSLHRQNFPYVLIDHRGIDNASPAVGATNWQGGYDATRHLIELGHKRIGFITGRMTVGCSIDRMDGYKTALTDHGLEVDPALILEGDFAQPSGYRCADALLKLPDPPTAIFASNDASAFGAMEAIRNHGLRIPDDISIVGFDDIPQGAHVNPPLTTVRQPLEEMGRTATQMLLQLIKAADDARSVERVNLPTELIVRASTCSARGS